MPKTLSPADALGRLPRMGLVRTYVWEKPVRVAHWLIFFAFLFLSFTGLYIHRPFLAPSAQTQFLMATMRFVHELAGFVLIAAFILRAYWFFKGNIWSRWEAYLPIHGRQWQGMWKAIEYYLFLRFEPKHRLGHNPLAALTYFFVYLILLFEILSGLALYDRVLGNPVLHKFIGWLPQAIELPYLRELHYFLMFVLFAFVIFHVYASILVSLEEENGLLDSIFSGWKFVPAGNLREEVAEIPEARVFAKRHELLPRAAPGEPGAERRPARRPGPGPITLYSNWISYAGTAIAAVGVLVFVVLGLYHFVGGGSVAQPYGDLVIFAVPPVFILIGVIVLLIGMYVQWIRWRKNKPLDFARYPQWDLNVARQRKALLITVIGAAVLAVPAIWGGYETYKYTDAVPFCGALCHSMTPEYVTYRLSPHAHVVCADCHVGPGASGYIQSKLRGVTELTETIQNNYPRPIPVPVTALRPIRGNCERCHWPAYFFSTREVRRAHFLYDEQNTRWDIDLLVNVGGGPPAEPARMGIHWHVMSKVEYVATDPERQNIPWVRSVDPRTGVATVFSSQPQPTAAPPPGEIRVMDCVDCHNRPTHIFQAPDRLVDVALAEGRIDPSLPYIKQQGATALAAVYTSREHALRSIESAVRGYYQKNYSQVYAGKQQAIDNAIAYLQGTYNSYFFPEMKVRWDTYFMNDTHFYFSGCDRCHDSQHKSVEGNVIRSDCGACHTILQQGKAGSLQFAKGPQGLDFEHPVDIGTTWAEAPCHSCHTGGPP